MKSTKKIAILFSLVLLILINLFVLSACDNASTSCQHQWKEATCVTPKTCTLCQETEGEAIGHDFSGKITSDSYLYSDATNQSPAKYYYSCIFCQKQGVEVFEFGQALPNRWEYSFYVDNQFGEPTNEWYIISYMLDGTFENSATDDAPLLAEIIYDCNDEISIFLYEYADTDNLVKNPSSQYKDYYKIVVKNEKGQTYEAQGQMWPGEDRIFIIDTYHSSVLNLMKTSKQLKFYIEYEDSPTTQYRFEVDMSNFNDVLDDFQ